MTAAPAKAKTMPDSPRIFICYARADNENPDPYKCWMNRLLEMLGPLELQGLAKAWSDEDVEPGEDWHRTIQDSLDQAVAAVLMISPAFLNSKYIRNSEIPVLLKNAEERGVKILPIIVRRCLYEEIKFKYPDPLEGPEELLLSSIQAANPANKPLLSMTEDEQDETLLKIARKLKGIVENPSARKPTAQSSANSAGAQPSSRVTWQIVLDGELSNTFDDKLYFQSLKDISCDESLSSIAEESINGSICLTVKGAEANYTVLESLINSGQLQEICGKRIEQIRLTQALPTSGRLADQSLSQLNPAMLPGLNNLSDSIQKRLRLSQVLSSLPSAQFGQILFALQAPRESIPGPSAPLGDRVAGLLEWAESPIGCGLDTLETLLNDFITPR
ncbi:MAG: TIR domain-containing protein [Leptolyngbya sp. SIOISBB]|nr:TIR domain-containing protein [Leptolyngbya sp. SIOISBB]